MSQESQISAIISRDTKELLNRHVRSTGMKKGHVIEMALRYHLQAMRELPSDVLLPPRIVVSRDSGAKIAARLKYAPAPTRDLLELMSSDED